jgi:hypothetical protein
MRGGFSGTRVKSKAGMAGVVVFNLIVIPLEIGCAARVDFGLSLLLLNGIGVKGEISLHSAALKGMWGVTGRTSL